MAKKENEKKESDSKLMDAYYEKPTGLATWSGLPLKDFYGPEDLSSLDYQKSLADPGEFPYTRGIHQDMFRGRYWTRTVAVLRSSESGISPLVRMIRGVLLIPCQVKLASSSSSVLFISLSMSSPVRTRYRIYPASDR